MSIADEIQKLEELRRNGTLSEREFAQAKAAVLTGAAPAAPSPASRREELDRIDREWEIEREQYAITDRFGRVHVPQAGATAPMKFVGFLSRGAGVFVALFGVIWTVVAYQITRDAPFPLVGIIFPAFGVLFVLFGLYASFGFAAAAEAARKQYEERAAKYQAALAAYQERRRQVEAGRVAP